MFLIRNVQHKDYPDLRRLSRELDTVNLPTNPTDLKNMIRRSVQSFSGKFGRDKTHAQYLFVMVDTNKQRVVGTSKIFAQHGSHDRPHVYFQVMHNKVSCRRPSRRLQRKLYRLKKDTQGYTEIGGLVLDNEYRSRSLRLGKQLSYIRFLWMRAHPGSFKKRVIAELLPPLGSGGSSSLYKFYGEHWTKLDYKTADLLSYKNKDFILKLFPKSDLYYDLLPPEVQNDLETTGPGSTAAKKMLERIGFRYANQIDPLDGGPNYIACRKEISVCQQTKRVYFGGIKDIQDGPLYFVLVESDHNVRAMVTPGRILRGKIFLNEFIAGLLCAKVGKVVYTYRW